MSNHTPGPWRYEASTKTIRACPSNYWLATMDSWDGAVNNEANARLIAAAPDLLEALEELVSRRESVCAERGEMDRLAGSDGRYNRARAAIAKAKGLS